MCSGGPLSLKLLGGAGHDVDLEGLDDRMMSMAQVGRPAEKHAAFSPLHGMALGARGVPNSAADLWVSFEVFTAVFDMHL